MQANVFGIDIEGYTLKNARISFDALSLKLGVEKNQSFYNKNLNINTNFNIISRTVSEKNKNNRFSIIMTRSSDNKFLPNFVFKLNYCFVELVFNFQYECSVYSLFFKQPLIIMLETNNKRNCALGYVLNAGVPGRLHSLYNIIITECLAKNTN